MVPPSEAAKQLGINRMTLYGWMHKRYVKKYKKDNRVFVKIEDILSCKHYNELIFLKEKVLQHSPAVIKAAKQLNKKPDDIITLSEAESILGIDKKTLTKLLDDSTVKKAGDLVSRSSLLHKYNNVGTKKVRAIVPKPIVKEKLCSCCASRPVASGNRFLCYECFRKGEHKPEIDI